MYSLTTFTLFIGIIPCYILLLTLNAAIFLALIGFVIIRTGVFCIIRVCLLSERSHEVAHVLESALKPPELLVEGYKVTVLP